LTQVLCRERKCCRLREVGHEIFVGHLPRQSNHCQLKSLLLQLKAAQVRLEPLASLLRPILVQFTTKVKDNLITTAATLASGALITLLGNGFKALLGL